MNKAENLQMKFDHQWGTFRRFIARNPLTGFWTGVAWGFLIGAFLL